MSLVRAHVQRHVLGGASVHTSERASEDAAQDCVQSQQHLFALATLHHVYIYRQHGESLSYTKSICTIGWVKGEIVEASQPQIMDAERSCMHHMVQHADAVPAARTGTATAVKMLTSVTPPHIAPQTQERCSIDVLETADNVMPLACQRSLQAPLALHQEAMRRTRASHPSWFAGQTRHMPSDTLSNCRIGKSRRVWMLLCLRSWSVHAPQLCAGVSESRRHRIQCILYTMHMCHTPACTQMSRLSSG